MKRLFDVRCNNKQCEEHLEVIEILHNPNNDFPDCKECGKRLDQVHFKTASFSISGGGVYKPGMSHSI